MEIGVGLDRMRVNGLSNRVFAYAFVAIILVFATACFGKRDSDESSLTPIPLVDAPYSPGRFESIVRDTTDTFISTALLATNVKEIFVNLSEQSEQVQSFLFSIDRSTNQVTKVPPVEEEAVRKTADVLADLRVEILDRGIFEAAGEGVTQPVARFAVLYSREVISLVELDERGAPLPDSSVNLDIERLRRSGGPRSIIIQKTGGGVRAWLEVEVLKSVEPEEQATVSPRRFTQDRPERSLDAPEKLNEGAVRINVRVRGVSPPMAARQEPSEDAANRPLQATEPEDEPEEEPPDEPLDNPPPNAPDEGIEQDDSALSGADDSQVPPSDGVPTLTDQIDDTIDPETSEGSALKPDKDGRPYQYANNLDIMIIIDSSGNMLIDDPGGERFDAAFAYLPTTLRGDLVGVLNFASYSDLTPLTAIDGSSLTRLKKTISEAEAPPGSSASGIGRALIASCQELVDHGRALSRAGIFISDGVETDTSRVYGNSQPEKCYIENGWPIYTIGIGNYDEARLRQLAFDTGGKFIPISDLTTLICEMQQLRSSAVGVESQPCISRNLGPRKSTIVYVDVPSLQVHATFSLNWDSGIFNLKIFRPSDDFDGLRPSYSSATAPRDVVRNVGDTNVMYKIPNPEPGRWKVEIYRLLIRGEDNTTSLGELPVVFGFSSLPAP